VDVLRATGASFFIDPIRKEDIETGIESHALKSRLGQSEQPGS
jgi:hypothetical protein